MRQPEFLPMSRAEMDALGWAQLDILLVTGDAYVDHPSFGAALLGRFLVSQGWRVGIIAQPDWKRADSVSGLGRPRLFAGVTAGAMDSMVANYTANKKLRRDDAFSPGGRYGLRPNRATLIYTNLVKHAFPGLPVVLGGIEASLRRLAHYDYWEDKIRRSLLLDAKADILVYGMGERPAAEIARRLSAGENLDGIPGTAVVRTQAPAGRPVLTLAGYDEILAAPELLATTALAEENERDWRAGKTLVQTHGQRLVIVNPPAEPLATEEMDALYGLPFTRRSHPSYSEPIPALAPVANSLVSHRGCFGGCSFCALGAHQGKVIQWRSAESILAEARRLTHLPSFHGTITDLGGPSANMYGLGCVRPAGVCDRPSCLFPDLCPHLATDHARQIDLLRRLSQLPGVKHVFIASGIRFDLALADPRYLRALIADGHVSGALKVAPEHVDPAVLKLMRKPGPKAFERFLEAYRAECRQQGCESHINAYFIATFPGSNRESMHDLSAFASRHHLHVEQMQDFIPLPMTLAGIMYHTGRNPWNGENISVAKSQSERKEQRKILLKKSRSKFHVPGSKFKKPK
jgi:uncharacterized radical SAM protein YgiQ